MKYFLISVLGVCLAGRCASVPAAEPADKVRPIQIISSAELPADVPFNVRPFNGGIGFEITYLAEGADLIGVDSLSVESIINRRQEDVSKHGNGEPTYVLGQFVKSSDDGKYCLFMMKVLRNQFGQTDSLSVKGSVTLLAGTLPEEKKLDLATTDDKEVQLGPFTIHPNAKTGFGFGGGASEMINIAIKGPTAGITELKLLDGDTDVQRGFAFGKDERTYLVLKPKSGKLTLSVRYWSKVEKRTVRLDHGPAEQK